MQEPIKPLDRNQLSVLIAVCLLGAVLFRFIDFPEQVWDLEPLGSPLEIRVTSTWLLIALLVGLVSAGTNLILHGHPRISESLERPMYVFWILPAVMTGLSAYVLSLVPSWPVWGGGVILLGIAIGLVISAEYATVVPGAKGYAAARLSLNMLAYFLTFVLFALIYYSRARSLVSATLMAMVAILLATDLLSVADVPLRRVALLALVVGLLIGECTWALNYWQINAWVGGLILLLVFYVVVNIALQYLLERLGIMAIVEFVVVAVIVLVVILLSIF